MASDAPDLLLRSELASVSAAGDHVEAVARDTGWVPDDVDRVVLATIEAVGNAVEHGPGGLIRVSVSVVEAGSTIDVQVSDGGEGPRSTRLDAAALPAPEALDGRGLFILDVLADAVRVREGTLRMTFRRRGAA